MEKYISMLILSFYIYSFGGWLWESLILSIAGRYKIRNRGFLNGPVIPIYGFGAILVILLFDSNEKFYSLFIEGGVVACVLEYMTSWAMEKLYHHRWWDYSDKPFNLNGRVCLEGFVCFGVFSFVCMKWLQPALFRYLDKYQLIPLIIIATVLTTLFALDVMYTIYHMTHLDEKIETFKKDLELFIEDFREDIENLSTAMNFDKLLVKMKELDENQYNMIIKNRKYIERRIITAFPHLLNKKRENKK